MVNYSAMPWVVKLTKDGNRVSVEELFDAVDAAVQAGNAAIRAGDADEVTIASREHQAIYYEFSSVRTASEERRISQMLSSELAAASTSH
ncbi:MAG TPA: hypothetical protein VHP33_17430 [Polyangiaceae bacterium]|nr:hypothetical protein [Polyangiaceae bacterium]